ncbi:MULTISPECIES: hypothetical protein, partial [Escherichia]|uniref:hypothetical protein n=1 Tax=Escherichia TaxID=561 RepID=UPI001BDD3045
TTKKQQNGGCFKESRNYVSGCIAELQLPQVTDVHPKSKNKSAVKALYLLTFTPNSKLFSSDYPYVPAWQYFWQLYL